MATMSIRDWFATFRKRRDAAAVERVEAATTTETPEEQANASADRTGAAADGVAARIAGQTPADVNRVNDE
jgi:hypothetical protein